MAGTSASSIDERRRKAWFIGLTGNASGDAHSSVSRGSGDETHGGKRQDGQHPAKFHGSQDPGRDRLHCDQERLNRLGEQQQRDIDWKDDERSPDQYIVFVN